MIRFLFYPLYWCAPYIVIYDALLYPHFQFRRFLLFSIFIIVNRSMAAHLKDAHSAWDIANAIKSLKCEFKIVEFATDLFDGAYGEMKQRLQTITKKRGLSTAPFGYDPTVLLLRKSKRRLILTLSKCDGEGFYQYTCMANRKLSLIFLPESPEEIAADPTKKFALYHELAHTNRANIAIFERQKFEIHIFMIFVFLMIGGTGPEAFWTHLLWIIPMTILGLEINARVWDYGKLAAEVWADNYATRLAFLIDQPLFNLLSTITLPIDRELRSEQEDLRRKTFSATLSKHRETGILYSLASEALPPIRFYFYYGCLVLLVGIAASWGRTLDDKIFDTMYIFLFCELATFIFASRMTDHVRKLIMKRVTGTVLFPVDAY